MFWVIHDTWVCLKKEAMLEMQLHQSASGFISSPTTHPVSALGDTPERPVCRTVIPGRPQSDWFHRPIVV